MKAKTNLLGLLSIMGIAVSLHHPGDAAQLFAPVASMPRSRAVSLVGRAAPSFTVRTLDGKQISLADYKGKALLVNFWATWCGACKVEMPWLAQLREQYAKARFEVVGILTDNASPNEITNVMQRYSVHYPILICNRQTAQAYGGLPVLPESFYIDRHGTVVAEGTGAASKGEIEANIRKALGGEPRPDHRNLEVAAAQSSKAMYSNPEGLSLLSIAK